MSAFPIPITAIFAALLALLLVVLSVRVTLLRRSKKVSLLDGGDAELTRAMRVQGNFIEYVPLALGLIGMAEWMHAPAWLVYLLAALLLLARISHAFGLSLGKFPARAFGSGGTWLVLVVAALVVLVRVA